MWGGDYLPEYIGGYICGSIRAGKPCSYKQLGEMRTFRFIVNQKWIAKNGMERREFSSVSFAFSLNYSSASLRLCVRFFRKPILFYYNCKFSQYIPPKNEYILHGRLNIYCICLRIYTSPARSVLLRF